MYWRYSRGDSKVLLLATLFVFSAYALMLWSDLREVEHGRQSAQTIGVVASVPENELNSVAMQLEDRARALDAREVALRESERTDRETLVLVGIAGGVLLALILLNFYLDNVRRRSV